ncbi:MAG TPA: polysaccharide deacetylase family protein [Bacteroidales bacterium]
MRKLTLFFAFTLVVNGFTGVAQTVPKPYEVATWAGFRQAAISYTFDDGCSNQFKVAIPLFDEYGFNLTMFTVKDWSGANWSALKTASDKGHEIASHTVTHANFSQVTITQQETELKDSKTAIEGQITNKKCLTMAYPYCVAGVDSICGKYYISARGCQGFVEGKTPASYYNISSVICGDKGATQNLSQFKTNFSAVAKSNGWLVYLFHGIDKDGGYSPITSIELRKSVAYLAARKPKFWVTTFLNATLYSKERNAVSVTETATTDSSMTLQVTDNLADSIYNYPLSIRRPLPEGWPSASVTQNNVAVPFRIVQVDAVVYLIFDVVPDAGEVKILKSSTFVTPEVDIIPADDVDPVVVNRLDATKDDISAVYNNNRILISLPITVCSDFVISVYDVRGVKLFYTNVSVASNEISVDVPSLKTGVYFVRQNVWSKKIAVS